MMYTPIKHSSKLKVFTIAILVIAGCSAVVNAETIFIDNFDDGDDAGWSYIDSNASQPWGPTSFDASTGSYNLLTPGAIPNTADCRGCVAAVWDQSASPIFSNGYLRAKVRSDQVDGTASLFMRLSGDLVDGVNGYYFSGFGDGPFAVTVTESTQILREFTIDGLTMSVGEDWWIEAGAVGNQISMKVWRDGLAEPLSPQLTFSDTTYSEGSLAVSSLISFGSDTVGPINATFDDISFTSVPEPSTVAVLLSVVAVSLPILSRKRDEV